jgi:hypothetical protein
VSSERTLMKDAQKKHSAAKDADALVAPERNGPTPHAGCFLATR